MARKKELDADIEKIQVGISKKKVIVGTKRTLVELRKGKVGVIYVTANCPAVIKEDVTYYSKLANCNVVNLAYDNDELGVLCKKPFSISVVGMLK